MENFEEDKAPLTKPLRDIFDGLRDHKAMRDVRMLIEDILSIQLPHAVPSLLGRFRNYVETAQDREPVGGFRNPADWSAGQAGSVALAALSCITRENVNDVLLKRLNKQNPTVEKALELYNAYKDLEIINDIHRDDYPTNIHVAYVLELDTAYRSFEDKNRLKAAIDGKQAPVWIKEVLDTYLSQIYKRPLFDSPRATSALSALARDNIDLIQQMAAEITARGLTKITVVDNLTVTQIKAAHHAVAPTAPLQTGEVIYRGADFWLKKGPKHS